MEFFNSLNFKFIFIFIVTLKLLLESYLVFRNISSIKRNKERIPSRFKDIVTNQEYSRAVNYNISKLRFQIVSSFTSSALLLLITLGGLLSLLTKIATETTSSNVIGAILLGVLFIIFSEIVGMPFSIYSIFFLEAKYGFNKTTVKTFILDTIKQAEPTIYRDLNLP